MRAGCNELEALVAITGTFLREDAKAMKCSRNPGKKDGVELIRISAH